MDNYQRNVDDDYSTITFNSPSFISSTTSVLDSVSKQSNVNVDRLKNRTRSFRKRYYQQQKPTEHQISPISTTIIEKQEARPLGTCVRKCIQCRQLKHILLAECTVCFRMMDVDLKDCKCQILTSRNIIDHFICSICNSELTLDGYIICANRTCQTILSALIKNENTDEKLSLSTTLTNICYPKSAHRTVAVQANTLTNLSPLQRFECTIIDNKNKELSSSSSCSKGDLNRIIITSSDSSGTSYLSMDSGVDASLNDIARNMAVGFNSNQPTKLALQSEDESRQTREQPSQIHNLTNTTDMTVNNSPEFTEIPKSPRCLAIMNVRKRRDRLSTLLKLSTNKTCQTQLSCLAEIDKMIENNELSDAIIIRTNNPNKIERQIQVDTIKGHFDDLCQVRIEISDRIEKDSIFGITNDERILRALTNKDGQRWSEFIDQLINEQSNVSPSEKAQHLLDTIERLHSTERLNSLTTGQLQRKVRYAMSQLKYFDERSYLQNHSKTTKDTRSGTSSRRSSECNGRVDMAVTVRQIDKPYNRQREISSEQNWKPYVDRLFEQGHSANEIQRLLHEGAKTTMQSDDQRLQDVFNYINIKANQQPVARQQFQTKNLFQSAKSSETTKSSGGIMTQPSSSISERKGKPYETSSDFKNKDQDLTSTITKNKSSLPNNSLFQSNTIQIQSSERISVINLNEDDIEPNVSMYSSPDQDVVTNPNASTIDKKQSINSAEITIKRETSNGKKSTSDNIIITSEQKIDQIQKVVESKTPKTSRTSSSDNRKISSTIGITPSNDTSLMNLKEKCINALHDVQNSLDNIHNTDVRLHSHPSNTQSELNKLITAFESRLYKSDNIESLMTQCVEHLNNEKKTIKSQVEENEFRYLNEKISNTINLLQEYKRIVMPMKAKHENSSFNRHISNLATVPFDTSVSSKRVNETIDQTMESPSQPSSKSDLDLKQQTITSDYQETASLMRCRPIPYTASDEKRSTATSEHISLSSKDDSDEQKPLKTESDSYNNQSQIEWLDSLLSKMSNNVSSTSDIVSTSPSLSVTNQVKVDLNEEQHKEEQKALEPINMEIVDKQVPTLNTRSQSSISIDQQTKNIPAIMTASQSTLYETDVIRLEEEHAMSIIVPDQDISVLDEQFQVIQTKTSQILNSEDQIAPIQNKVSNDTSQKSPSTANDQSQSMITPSSSHSNVDLSEQLDQRQIYENITSSEQLAADNTSTSETNFESQQKPFDSENDEKISSGSASGQMTSSKADSNNDPETSTKSSSSNDQTNEEKRTTSNLSFSSDEDKNQDLIKINEPSAHIERMPDSSQSDIQTLDKATSQIMSRQNDINKLQLPLSTQHISISNSIKSNSLLTDLHDQDDIDSSKKSISSDNPLSDVQEHLSTKISSSDSENQNNDDKLSSNEKIDNMVNAVIHAPVMLSPNLGIAQQPANIVLSPLRTTKIEDNKYKKLITPSFVLLKPTSLSTTTLPREKELASKLDSIPRLFIEEPSGSGTPMIHVVTADDDHDDKRPHTSTPSAQKTPIDNRTKDDLRNKLQTEYNLSILSNASKQEESSSSDDIIRTPPLPFKSTESLSTGIRDGQQSETPSKMNRKYSRPKILIEDVQSPFVLTPHSSILSTTPDDDTQKKIKQDDEKQSNKTPVQSYIKEKSSSKETIPNQSLDNTPASEHSTTKYEKSEENPSVHSLLQSEQSQHDEDYPSKRDNSFRIESLIKLLPSPPDKQSMDDNHSETEDVLDQSPSPYLIDYENQSNGRLDNRKPSYLEQHLSPMTPHSIMNRVKWPSSVITKKSPMISSIPTILPSPVINVKIQGQKLKSQLSSLESKNDKSTPEENQESISVSSFNFAHRTILIPNNHHETEHKQPPSQSGKSLLDDTSHPIKSKQQSSSTNSLVLGSVPSSSIPKLLLKRSSMKQPSAIISSTKPSTTLSITDVSTSSSNTIATDHLITTHSTISDHEEIIALKKTNKKHSSKNGFTATSESVSKRNILKKPSRPSQNQSFVSENRKKQHVKTSMKKLTKSRNDINQILMMNEQDEEKPQVYERQRKKQNKNRIVNRSRMLPFKLKAQSDHQGYIIDSSRLPNIEQTYGEHHLKKVCNDSFRRRIIRLPVTQIEKFECGTIGPHLHPSSVAHQIFSLPSIYDRPQISSEINEITESFTDRLYSLMSPENNTDEQAFESILHWQHHQQIPKIDQNKYQYMYLLDTSAGNSIRGKQYPILTDEIDMIDDPNACTIVNKWAFADLVNDEREKFIQESIDNINKSNPNKHIKICLRKRPLTEFEENVLKEVDIISITDPQTLLLHIPSITVDNQVFIKNRKFKCDQTFDEHCPMNTIYHSTLAPLLDTTIDGSKCLCLIGGGKYSGKTYLLRSLIDLLASDLNRLLSTYDIYIKLLGICHNRIVDILQNYSSIRLMKWTLIPNVEFRIENDDDIDYITCQLKKRRRFMHQLIEINFREKNQSIIIGSLMIVILASSQYVYTRNLCSHRRKFLINSLNKTILSFKRALLGIRQNPDRVRTAFNNDILTRLIQPYIFHGQSNICYIGTLNPGHRHRIATKSTLEFARNLRFCLKRINKKRRQRKNYVE